MRKLILFALVAFAGIGSASLASAQTHQLRGRIPFGFTAGTSRLSPGEYRIDYDMNGLLTFRNMDNGDTAIAIAGADRGVKDGACKLIFAHHGDQYFLKRSSCDSVHANFFLPTSSLEKKALELTAAKHDGQQTVIAMK